MQKKLSWLQQIIFYLLLLFFPTQLARHFWPDFSYVLGLRIDYLSPTIYFTDILIVLLFLVYGLKRLPNIRFLFFSFCFLILSTLFAANITISFLKLLKILELIFLGFFISQELGKSINVLKAVFFVSATVFYESVLSIWQFINQSSVGGLWWLLGERTFTSGTPFVAQAAVNGQLILRSYGTFSHPNVLGGYLAVALPVLVYALFNLKNLTTKYFIFVSLLLGTTALFFTFSRTAWIAFAVAGLILIAQKVKNKQLGIIAALSGVLILWLSPLGKLVWSRFITLEDIDHKSLVVREQLNNAALKIISTHPLFGIGLNNFLTVLPNYYHPMGIVRFFQPAHNIYLMIAAETGMVGLFLFSALVFLTVRRLVLNTLIPKFFNSLILLLLAEILFIGLFDHYFYTLQQGQLLAAFVFGLAWTKKARL